MGAYCAAATEEPGAYEVQAADGGKWGVFTRMDFRLLGTFTGPNAEARARLFARAHADIHRLVAELRLARVELLRYLADHEELAAYKGLMGGCNCELCALARPLLPEVPDA